jgi:MoaA/NifB/PqqE/SkfB family radical SAM enzyme/SAM-dependent methyltransferase
MRGDTFFIEIAKRPPFTKLHPTVAAFFKNYLSHEKVVRFDDRWVVNTHFPPYPSRAFDNLANQFGLLGESSEGRLYSVTLAVTNRCDFRCWHCYNAGRSQVDMSFETLEKLARQLQDLGAVTVTLTGGEPLLRRDLAKVAALFDDRSMVIVGTTGAGLTADRARRLRDAGVFALGISLDSTIEEEHDRLRGVEGAFRIALDALETAREQGLYPYVVTVATRELLQPERFLPFLRFAAASGAVEVHLLEPSATGNLAGRTDVLLRAEDRKRIFDYQEQVAADESLPILSSFLYLESPEAFGCGAGLTHLYVDGSGEVCPCNLVPMSFGNVAHTPLLEILGTMRRHFCQVRTGCVGQLLARHFPPGPLPTPPEVSERICSEFLPRTHAVPRFFQVRAEARDEVGRPELQAAYDRIHADYDTFWLAEAAGPIDDLVRRVQWTGTERVFEAGCGTGYATAQLAARAREIVAADLSAEMLELARERLGGHRSDNVRLVAGDALAIMKDAGLFDVIFSSWVLGYIPLRPFFDAASGALGPGGRVAFVVHRENSPREPLEIFAELVARDPTALTKRVAFDFPRDGDHVRDELAQVGLRVVDLWEGAAVFRYDSAEGVLEHLLKSGAGTAFHDAIDPARRGKLTEEFLEKLALRHPSGTYEVVHEYIACVGEH